MFLNLILYILLKNSVVIKIVDVQEQNWLLCITKNQH